MISGVEKTIGTMKEKESVKIDVKPQYAYGDEGNDELGIPGGAELVYEVQMNNFTKVSELGRCRGGNFCSVRRANSA